MKSSKIMRVAVLLIVAVAFTSHAVCGTFAKYVTSEPVDETARVAKWGVVITASADPLFKTEYISSSNAVTVHSADTNKVIAPGTSGTLAGFAISGQPEVATVVTYSGSFALGGDWMYGEDFYCPLQITVGGTTFNGLDYTSKEDFQDDVNELITSSTTECIANTDLSQLNLGVSVSWSWAYMGATGEAVNQTNEADSYLAYVALHGETKDTVSLTMSASVDQID